MSGVFLVLRLLLAGTFAYAGFAKARDISAVQHSAGLLGLPAWAQRLVGPLLPWVEVSLAVGLLLGPTTRASAVGIAVLLLLFSALLVTNIAAGRRPSCNCFGQANSKPIGASSLIRNGALFVAAVAVVWAPNGDVLALLGADVAPENAVQFELGVLGTLAIGELAIILRLWSKARFEGVRDMMPAGLPIGSVAPRFELPNLKGAFEAAPNLDSDLPTLLIFIDPNCGPCEALLPDISDWQESFKDVLTTEVISTGSVDANLAKTAGLNTRVLIQEGDEVARAYGVQGTPSATLIGTSGRILEPAALGIEAVRQLAARAIGPRQTDFAPDAPPLGEEAPLFTLPTLEGTDVSLGDLRGSLVLLLHWRDTCPHCEGLVPDLSTRAGLIDQPDSGLRLLYIVASRGDVRRRTGRMILVDEEGLTTRAFALNGTPAAILIDANGKVASAPSVGSLETLQLVDRAITLTKAASGLRALTH